MKKLVLVSLIAFLSVSVNAQHVFNKGTLLFNAGIGLPAGGWGFIPTINVSGEIGVIPTGDVGIVSFGGLAEIQFANYANDTKVYPIFIIGPRAAWHLQVFESDKWDVYGGVGFGVKFGQNWNNGNGTYDAKVSGYGEGFVGGRMMFSEALGLFAEVGGGSRSFVKFGVTFGF